MYPVTSLERAPYPYKIDVVQTPCHLTKEVIDTYRLDDPDPKISNFVEKLFAWLSPTIVTATREGLRRSWMLGLVCKNDGVMQEIFAKCALTDPRHQVENSSEFGEADQENGISGIFFKSDKQFLNHRLIIKTTEDNVHMYLLFSKALVQQGGTARFKNAVYLILPKDDSTAPSADLIGLKSSALETHRVNGMIPNLFKKISGDQLFSREGLAPKSFASILYRGHEYHKVVLLQEAMTGDIFSFNDLDVWGFEQFLVGYRAVKSLAKLHELGYAHGDVKSENFVYNQALKVKVIDFDTHMKAGPEGAYGNCFGTTFMYLAPEYFIKIVKGGDREVDMQAMDAFGLGHLLYEIFTKQRHPWSASLNRALEQRWSMNEVMKDGNFDWLVRQLTDCNYITIGDESIRAVVKGLLHPDPSERMSVREAWNRMFECYQFRKNGYIS